MTAGINVPILKRMPTPPKVPLASKSLFAQVQARLRADILSNRLKPGAKLPSEAELETGFGVSRITVRHALSALHAEGLIEKINGKGSFVTRPDDAPRLGPLTGFYEHMRASGGVARGKTLSVREGKATAVVAEALRIAPGTPLLTATLLRWVNDEPIACGVIQAEPALTRALLAQDLNVNDVMVVLESRLGYRLKSSHIEAGAVAAGKMRGRLLHVDEAAPLLRVRFTPHDATGKPLVFSEMYFRADRFSYKAVLKR
jgi:GntR family transcriptional regulator